MIQRFDNIAVELPVPSSANPAAAAAVQELMGGKFGEMSTLMNYTFQSFNFRGKEQYRPFYDLLCNIAAEEFSHIEAVAAAINLLLSGATTRTDRNATAPGKSPKTAKASAKSAKNTKSVARKAKNLITAGGADPAPLEDALGANYPYHFLASAQAAVPFDSMGNPWNGSYVTATGNLKMDLLHNFFLECGARANKMRVYEMCADATARAMVGYLLVRGGVHIVAYAKALEKLTGANVGQLLPIPDVSNKKFPEAMKHEAKGLHLIMWSFHTGDYPRVGEIWNGPHPEDGGELEVRNEMPEGFPWPPAPEEPQLVSPGAIDPEMLNYYAKKLG
jgi:manganese catalase